jgi:hypothetical protein
MATGKDAKVTISEWARSRGIPSSTAGHAATSGRITRDGRGRVDPAQADREWNSNGRARVDSRIVPTRGLSGARRASNCPSPEVRDAQRYRSARAKKEEIQSKIADLELKVRSGELVNKAKFQAGVYEVVVRVRERLLSIPARVAPVVAGLSDIDACYATVEKEIFAALDELADANSYSPRKPRRA